MALIIAILFLIIFIVIAIIIGSMHYVTTSKKPEDSKITCIKQVNSLLELCKIESGKGNVADRLIELEDLLKYSDVNSPESARDIEFQILEKASVLLDHIKNKRSADANRNLDELSKLIKEREIIIKNNK